MDVVPLPCAEVTWCPWPQDNGDLRRTRHHQKGQLRHNRYAHGCYRQHPELVIWNGAEWWCVVCDTPAKGTPARSFYTGQTPHDPEFEHWGIPYRIARRDARDNWYARETAIVRRAAVSHSAHGRLRTTYNPWNEDAPGQIDYHGQRRRWR